MDLKKYLEIINMSHAKFSEYNGISPTVLSLYLNGKRRLRYRHAKRIEGFTNKKVTVIEIMEYSDKFGLK